MNAKTLNFWRLVDLKFSFEVFCSYNKSALIRKKSAIL